MNCKNCQHQLNIQSHFCENCGAKVVTERITFKALFLEVIVNVFGFDSKFFTTLRMVARQPHVVLSDVLNGVRKRHMNPFAFLAVGAAISLVVFNYFEDDFRRVNSEMNQEQIAEYQKKATMDIASIKDLSPKEIQKLEIEKRGAQFQLKFLDGMMDFMLHYYNLLTFVFLLFYAVLSKWTFWKPHNFGEHIVINAYIYGFTTYLSLLLFFLAILIHPSIYMYSMFLYMLFYMFAFGKFYKLSIGKNILKLLRFFLGLIILFIMLLIVASIIGFLLAYFGILTL